MDCAVCLVEHDPDIHAATVRVRAWFRGQVTMALTPVKAGKKTKNRRSWVKPASRHSKLSPDIGWF